MLETLLASAVWAGTRSNMEQAVVEEWNIEQTQLEDFVSAAQGRQPTSEMGGSNKISYNI